MAEVSVLSPSSHPTPSAGAGAATADGVVDIVDVNIEDAGGGPPLMETEGEGDRTQGQALDPPRPANVALSRLRQSYSDPGFLTSSITVSDSVPSSPPLVDHSCSEPTEPWPEGDASPTDVVAAPAAGAKRRSTTAEPDDDQDDDQPGKKKRHRRKNKGGKHHRKWKPYSKMTWEEKKTQEERESRRAVQKRQQMAACGQPMAPYNTTQFLMEQHEDTGLSLEETSAGRAGKSEGSGSIESSDEYYESPNDEQEIFQEKDFTEAYESFHAERLQAMTKDELVREHLQLESKVERLECRLKDLGENNCEQGDSGSDKSKEMETDSAASSNANPSTTPGPAPEVSAASRMRMEIQRLRTENGRLTRENQGLRQRWKEISE